MAPDALRLEAFYELRIFGLQVVRAAEVLAKVRAIVCGLQHACRPKNDFRLTPIVPTLSFFHPPPSLDPWVWENFFLHCFVLGKVSFWMHVLFQKSAR